MEQSSPTNRSHRFLSAYVLGPMWRTAFLKIEIDSKRVFARLATSRVKCQSDSGRAVSRRFWKKSSINQGHKIAILAGDSWRGFCPETEVAVLHCFSANCVDGGRNRLEVAIQAGL